MLRVLTSEWCVYEWLYLSLATPEMKLLKYRTAVVTYCFSAQPYLPQIASVVSYLPVSGLIRHAMSTVTRVEPVE